MDDEGKARRLAGVSQVPAGAVAGQHLQVQGMVSFQDVTQVCCAPHREAVTKLIHGDAVPS